MNLFRNIIGAFMALFVLAVAAPASAKTNLEVRACVDKSFASAPFTGTLAERELRARSLHAETDTVLIEGARVAATAPIWTLCEGPSLTEQLATANERVSALETENARLHALAYHDIADDSDRLVRVSWKDTAVAIASERGAARTALKSAYDADSWQFAIIGAFLAAFLIAAFRDTLDYKLDSLLYRFTVWKENRSAAKARKRARPAPAKDEPSTLGNVHGGPVPTGTEPDERPTYAPGQP